ncbi:hypothetical protein M885DRAFT_613872 [Pelagophyceae sp. CCMP2097]|nr:hypothetical protein M885DRAFT_613872 [Pelagophyceae sp. CCMP2097]
MMQTPVAASVKGGPSWASDDEPEEAKVASVTERTTLRAPEAGAVDAVRVLPGDLDFDVAVGARRGALLTFFICVSALAIIAALLLAGACGATLAAYARQGDAGLLDVAIRCYTILLCLVVVFVEFEIGQTARTSAIARLWSLRGLFYAFVGVLALASLDDDDRRRACADSRGDVPLAWHAGAFMSYSLYVRICAFALLGLGGLYFVMGLLCCKHFKQQLALEYRRQLALHELKQSMAAEQAHKRPAPNPAQAV